MSVAPRAWTRLDASLRDRLIAAFLGLPSWVVLGVALSLEADPAGHGTHKQLGLGTCSILAMTGWPCPMCGMTTTFTHMAHGQLFEALLTQPFGVVLFLLTLACGGLAVVELVRPARRFVRIWSWVEQRETAIAGGLMGGLLLGWVYKLAEMGVGPFGGIG